ncbi:MAG TPA: glycosyltransferase family 39 protein [Phycisphaerae bacterium]|nr:glycosyltransferase family 39 protein [Phycisphaerae bacterium]
MNQKSTANSATRKLTAADRPTSPTAELLRSRPIVALLAVALLIRGVAMWEARHAHLVLDEQLYAIRADALLDGRGFLGSYQSWVRHPESPYMAMLPQYPGAYQPPAYVVFLAAVMGVTGRSILAVKAAQVLLSTFTVLIVYAIGRSWFDRRRGLIAAWICALYPNLIAFSHYLWTETFFIFLLLLSVWVLTRAKRVPGLRSFLVAGVILGLAALTRSSVLYFAPVLMVWLVVTYRAQWRPALAGAIAMAVMMAVTILPWTIRNYRLYNAVVLIDTNGPFNLWRGNDPTTFSLRQDPAAPKYAPPFERIPMNPVGLQNALELSFLARERFDVAYPTDLQMMQCARDLAWDCIRVDFVGFLGRAGLKMWDMWNPTSFLIRHLRLGAYGPVSPIVEGVITWAAGITYLLVMILGVIGWSRRWWDARAWLVLLLLLFHCAIYAAAFGLTRFRLPLMPFIILFAANGLALFLPPRGAHHDEITAETAPTPTEP